jgi:hypothetical protein
MLLGILIALVTPTRLALGALGLWFVVAIWQGYHTTCICLGVS